MSKIPHFLSIVMPVYNEAGVVEEVVRSFSTVLDRFENSEFIIVDDKSTDSTLKILYSLKELYPNLRIIEHEKNQGHGSSLIRAYKESRGDCIFHCDSDNQFFAEDFWLLWNQMEKSGNDIVIGYRKKRHDPFSRLLLTRLVQYFHLIFFGVWLVDSNSPFKIHKRKILNELLSMMPEKPLLPSILMAVGAVKKKIKIDWVVVRHKPRLTGLSFIRGWKIFKISGKGMKEMWQFRKSLKQIIL